MLTVTRDPISCAMLSDDAPLSEQLRTMAEQLAGMMQSGEFDALSVDTRFQITTLRMGLAVAAVRARETVG